MTAAHSTTSERQVLNPARAGVIRELTDGGRLGDLDTLGDLVDDNEWPFLEAVWRVEPKVVWIAWWTMSLGVGAPDLAHPIRELRRRAARRGVSRSTWKRLVGESNAAALQMFEVWGSSVLEAHLRLETLLKRPLPFEGPSAEWTRRFCWRPTADHFDLERGTVELTPPHGAYLAGVGLARMASGSFNVFLQDEVPLVLRYWHEIVEGRRLPPWRSLLARARVAQERATATEDAKTCRWESGLIEVEFAGFRITALSDSYALWREGLTMRHCIADFAHRCAVDGLRVFHLESEPSDPGWTLALEPDGEEDWLVHEIRGPSNRLPTSDVLMLAAGWSLVFAGIFPPGKNGLTPVRGDLSEGCPVCDDKRCQEHLLADIEIDAGLVDGRLCDLWGIRSAEIQMAMQRALLNQRANHEWPSEVDSIYAALVAQRHRLVVEDHPRDADFNWIIDEEAFYQAWWDIGAERLLLNYLAEWLSKQPTIVIKPYEIFLEPTLGAFGRRFHAGDPNPIMDHFFKAFCVWPTRPSHQKSQG